MKTVIVPAPGKIEIRQVETPVINAYQALVKTEMVALCNATDSKLIAGNSPEWILIHWLWDMRMPEL